MKIISIHGGIFFQQILAERDANQRNIEDGAARRRLEKPFEVIALAQQNTIIGWTVVDTRES